MNKTYLILTASISILSMQTACASLKVIFDSNKTISAKQYLNYIQVPNQSQILSSIKQQSYKFNGRSIDMNHLEYPAKSSFIPGKVINHKINIKTFSTVPIFIIGNDKNSLEWAKQNSEYLIQIHAYGIITNVENSAQTKEVEHHTKLELVPANIDGLGKKIGTNHYPLLVYKGWVMQ